MIGIWATITVLLLGFNVLVIELVKVKRQQRYLETQQYDLWNQLGRYEKELKRSKETNKAE
ncbi:hypothetical protein K7T73_12570 [Bacillus badius]|uniref:hypothetical protein n=1 Tax=Bacillus badius TaxID=1455 RepID=UPI001CBE69FF|nr:hypothetical protein [Bacillus badius]UAT29434.1 hypothetical protein K7T73_12570 [Bacillus badius]